MNKNGIKVWFLAIVSVFIGMSLNAQVLYVGANYHPHDDKNPEKIKRDIQLKILRLNLMNPSLLK